MVKLSKFKEISFFKARVKTWLFSNNADFIKSLVTQCSDCFEQAWTGEDFINHYQNFNLRFWDQVFWNENRKRNTLYLLVLLDMFRYVCKKPIVHVILWCRCYYYCYLLLLMLAFCDVIVITTTLIVRNSRY